MSINLSHNSSHNGGFTLSRLNAIASILANIFLHRKLFDCMYLTLSESVTGNIKDLLIILVGGRLGYRSVVHLHGGSFNREVLAKSKILRILNSLVLSRVKAAIVSGYSHNAIFGTTIPNNRIYIVPNFSPGSAFIDSNQIASKFLDSHSVLRVIYVSSMIAGKGYMTLLEAYEGLSQDHQSRVQIDFAGKFYCNSEEQLFLKRILSYPLLSYHGVVDEQQKMNLFSNAHIFCLPTRFYEGQPISILEAYASGCVVLTTQRPGICDIFEHNKNGFFIDSSEPSSLTRIFANYCLNPAQLLSMAIRNRQNAHDKYRETNFVESIESCLLV